LADYSFDDRFETVAITWSQPEAAVMLSMFEFYGIPAFAVGRLHVSIYAPVLTALQGIQIRVAIGFVDEALDLLAEVAERPATVRPYAFGSRDLYLLLVILTLMAAVAMPFALAFVDADDDMMLMTMMLMSPLLLVFNGAPPPRTPSYFLLWKRSATT
jgi:hypothetical protein